MGEPKYTYPAGYEWRFNAPSDREKSAFRDVRGDGKSFFDELVVDNWLHIEHMGDSTWWMRIGDALNMHITITPEGKLNVQIEDYEDKGQVAEMLTESVLSDVVKKLYSGGK